MNAVIRVLADEGERMRVAQVHAAVEALLGEAVSKGSVSWCLSADLAGRSDCLFESCGAGMRGRSHGVEVRAAATFRRTPSAYRWLTVSWGCSS